MPDYTPEPRDQAAFTRRFDDFYSRFAPLYDAAVRFLPLWNTWLHHALPHLKGPRVLEVSFGTGYLLTRYAGRLEACGVDINARMVRTAASNLRRAGVRAFLARGSVEALPYRDVTFDSVVCTMAFSGYPDGRLALSEMLRVLAPDCRLIIIDVNYPAKGGRAGTALARLWERTGDIIRDMHSLFRDFGLDYSDREIGGFGSIHLYLAGRSDDSP